MGLLSSTIQNLSNMALNESSVEIPQVAPPALVDEFKAMLDTMPVLEQEEMVFPVYAVPVRSCSRLGRYLIEMEDLSRYMITNGKTNIMEAISEIGEYNGIRLDDTNCAMVIDEASILQEMDELGMNIGGSNSNDGNIGTVGLLGVHTDLGKFRRFANSREFVDVVSNKYGLPIVKKNYTIGLIEPTKDTIRHDGNVQESADEKMKKKASKEGQEVINEKDAIEEGAILDHIRNGGKASDFLAADPRSDNPYAKFANKTMTTDANGNFYTQTKDNKAMVATNPTHYDTGKYSMKEDVDPYQMMRDIAAGKYDAEIMSESYGGASF